MSTRDTGTRGESIATEYLRSIGYRIVAQNFRLGRHGEIDAIAYDGTTLVFIEIKYRRTRAYGSPEDSVTEAKRARIRRIAEGFLAIHPHDASEYRYDVIAIEQTSQGQTIRHWKNAFW
jgi:putative endonuclease